MKNLINGLNNLGHNFVNNGGHFVTPLMPILGNFFGINLRGLFGTNLYRDKNN